MKEIVVQNDPVGEDELVIQDEAALKRVTFCSLGMSNTKLRTKRWQKKSHLIACAS